MTRIRVDPARLEELGRQLAALRNEFETTSSTVDRYEDAAGHDRLADRLRHLATNWSDVRPEVLALLDELARVARARPTSTGPGRPSCRKGSTGPAPGAPE